MMIKGKMTEQAHQIIAYHDESKRCLGGPKILQAKIFQSKTCFNSLILFSQSALELYMFQVDLMADVNL